MSAPTYQMPDWLKPYKNEWRTIGKLQSIMFVEDASLAAWMQEVRQRIKCVTEPAKNGKGFTRRYLVKHVWAVSRAHNIRLSPTSESDLVGYLESKVAYLSQALQEERLKQKTSYVEIKVDRTRDGVDLLRLMLLATEPRPVGGVYFLLSLDNEIVYVGQSQNVLARMSGHTNKSFSTVKMIAVENPVKRLEVEAKLISLMSPSLNIKHVDRVPAAGLNP